MPVLRADRIVVHGRRVQRDDTRYATHERHGKKRDGLRVQKERIEWFLSQGAFQFVTGAKAGFQRPVAADNGQFLPEIGFIIFNGHPVRTDVGILRNPPRQILRVGDVTERLLHNKAKIHSCPMIFKPRKTRFRASKSAQTTSRPRCPIFCRKSGASSSAFRRSHRPS